MSFFSKVPQAPKDPLFGLFEQFMQDENPKKVNLTIGVYAGDDGVSGKVLSSVKEAERRVVDKINVKGYLPIQGTAGFADIVGRHVLGDELAQNSPYWVSHTPGGTGAIRLVADFLDEFFAPNMSIWIGVPSWAPHLSILGSTRLQIKTYPYFEGGKWDFGVLEDSLNSAQRGDCFLFHGVCHNPTGHDPSREEWDKIIAICAERGLLPLIDLAYQGLGSSLEDDAYVVRKLFGERIPALVAVSFSKSLGLYRERVGALLVSADEDSLARISGQLKSVARRTFSNPPAHGGAVAEEVLGTPELREIWHKELCKMRDRVIAVRHRLAKDLSAAELNFDASAISKQKGMFSCLPLDKSVIQRLRKEYGIYMLESGRVNISGLNSTNIDYFIESLLKILKG